VAFENTLAPGLTGNQEVINPALSYKVNEKENSGYVQGDFSGELPIFGGMHYSGNAGVRLVETDLTVTQNNLSQNYTGAGGSYNGVFLADGQIITDNDYFYALPSFNISFDITDKQKLRLAVNKAVARQDLSLLGQAFQAYYTLNNGRDTSLPSTLQFFQQASAGNPSLQPFRSTNWQGSYEWYFHRGSLLSAALFYIDVDSFPLASTVIEKGPQEADSDGVVRNGGPVSTTVNGGGGSIKGLELSYQQNFDFLPSFLSGFGTDLNFTLADSTTNNVDATGQKEMLPDNSKYQANAILFYQKGPWQGRLAYNWRSKEFLANEAAAAPSGSGQDSQTMLGVYAKEIGFMDASLSYDVNRHLTVFAQATNMTGSNQHQYLEYPDVFYGSYTYETRVFFGVRLRN
jgi:TonB-dependent receptor